MSTSQRPHKKLRVWQYAMEPASMIYRITKEFPQREDFGLTAQLRRSAVSVPSNIAEGMARMGKRERIQFLYTSQGSLSELDTQVELAEQIGYITDDVSAEVMNRIQDVQMLLSGLIRSLRQNAAVPPAS